MSLAQRVHFLQDVFQMTAIVLVSVINHHINGLYLFWDTLYLTYMYKQDLAFNNQQELICHKTQLNQTNL